MKRLCALLLPVMLVFGFAQNPARAANNFSGREGKEIVIQWPLAQLTVGEKLLFEVFWMGIPVGEGSLEVKDKSVIRGRETYHVIAVAKTNDFLTKIYPIYDEIHSYFDAETFNTLEFRKTVREGRYRADEHILYDYEQKKIFYESFLNKSKKEYPLSGGVQDFLSAFFWFRVQPVRLDDEIHTKINDEDKDWDLELDVLRAEKRELRGRRVLDTFVVEPRTSYKGVFERRGRAWVYFTADEKRIPVWITMTTPFGLVTGVIKSGI